MSVVKRLSGLAALTVGLSTDGTLVYHIVRAGQFGDLKCGLSQPLVIVELILATASTSLAIVGGALVVDTGGKLRAGAGISLAATWMAGLVMFVGFVVLYPDCPFPSR